MKLSVIWFRRDLRLEDNTALNLALSSGLPVLAVFIFDENILGELPRDDARVSFLYERLEYIHSMLREKGSSIKTCTGDPVHAWEEILADHDIDTVYVNKDYEPYAIERDAGIKAWLNRRGVRMVECKDQVIFEADEIVKENGQPYTVYTPYKNRWLQQFHQRSQKVQEAPGFDKLYQAHFPFPGLAEIGFQRSMVRIRDHDLARVQQYASTRDFPAEDSTSYLGPHLRFGTISIRQVIQQLKPADSVFLGELIWREFFMQILWHFPGVVDQNFNARYNGIIWRNNESEFDRWCRGETGYPLVDAGMRQLNETGYMHNRVRMLAASFLSKHLLIDWRWGEAYFAMKLLDYELSSNNGNWQWAAGTGCDAVPYFRIFNPVTQLEKFDRDGAYTKKWLPELGTPDYPAPMVEHKSARERALEAYRKALRSGGA